jgi:hypothetical protein
MISIFHHFDELLPCHAHTSGRGRGHLLSPALRIVWRDLVQEAVGYSTVIAKLLQCYCSIIAVVFQYCCSVLVLLLQSFIFVFPFYCSINAVLPM